MKKWQSKTSTPISSIWKQMFANQLVGFFWHTGSKTITKHHYQYMTTIHTMRPIPISNWSFNSPNDTPAKYIYRTPDSSWSTEDFAEFSWDLNSSAFSNFQSRYLVQILLQLRTYDNCIAGVV